MKAKAHLDPLRLLSRSQLLLEFSYFSAILVVWSSILAVLFRENNVKISSIWMILQCFAVAFFKMNESLIVIPLLVFTQICYVSTLEDTGQTVSSLQRIFYGSSLCSHGFLFAEVCRKKTIFRKKRPLFVHIFQKCFFLGCFLVLFFAYNGDFLSALLFVYPTSGFLVYTNLCSVVGSNEASIVSSLIGYYASDILVTHSDCGAFCFRNRSSTNGELFEYFFSRDVLLFAFVFAQSVSWIRKLYESIFLAQESPSRKISSSCMTAIIVITLGVEALALMTAYQHFFHISVFTESLSLVLQCPARFFAVVTWATVVPIAVVCIHFGSTKVQKTIRRKLFHILAFTIFIVPAVLVPTFLSFSVAVCTALFIIVEVGRYHQACGASFVSSFFRSHVDSREKVSGVVRSHIYLLYGFGMSAFFNYRFLCTPSTPVLNISTNVLPGIVGLGLVDTGAAVGGNVFGKGKELSRYLFNSFFPSQLNPSLSHKTWPGFLSGFGLGIALWAVVLRLLLPFPFSLFGYEKTCLGILATAVLESFTDGIDNLQLPLLTLAALYTIFAVAATQEKMD